MLGHSSCNSTHSFQMAVVGLDTAFIKTTSSTAGLVGPQALARSPKLAILPKFLLPVAHRAVHLGLLPFLRSSKATDSVWLLLESLPSTMMLAISRCLTGTAL